MNYLLITAFADRKQTGLVAALRSQGNTVQLLRTWKEETAHGRKTGA